MAGRTPKSTHISQGRVMNQPVRSRSSVTNVRFIAVTGMLAAIAVVLMFLDFSIPILIPSFIKFDFSEMPALIGSFAFGPVCGAIVCLTKNLINLMRTSTGGIGELCNFLLGVCFVVPAGWIYHRRKSRRAAMVGALAGAAIMAGLSVFINYYISYPVYTKFIPMDAILGMYRALNPRVETLWDALIWFNMPFTFFKGVCTAALVFPIYKPLSPILKGRR